MIPGMVMLVPLFVLVSNLGMVNTYFGLILPFLAGPFGVFLMRQFIQGIPDELIDAARVDGAGEFRISNTTNEHQQQPGLLVEQPKLGGRLFPKHPSEDSTTRSSCIGFLVLAATTPTRRRVKATQKHGDSGSSGHRRDVRIAATIADETANLRNQSVMAGLGVAVGLVAALVAPFHHVPALPFLLLVGIAAALWSVRIARGLVIADRRASYLPRFIGGIERDAVLKNIQVYLRGRVLMSKPTRRRASLPEVSMRRYRDTIAVAVLLGLVAAAPATAQVRDRYDNSIDMRAPLSAIR